MRGLEQFPILGVAFGNVIDIPTDFRYLYTEKNYIFNRLEFDKVRIIRILNELQKFVDHLFYGVKENNENIKKDNE